MGCQVTFKQVFFSRRRYIRPEFLAGKAKTQRSWKCQVYGTVVAGNGIRQANKTAHVLRERHAVEKHSTIVMTAQTYKGRKEQRDMLVSLGEFCAFYIGILLNFRNTSRSCFV